jgi:nucleotide-binding universal stress UspA family protein
MDSKILIAFDDSENAMRAVDFITKNFNTAVHVTLLSIIPDSAALCEMNSPELIPYFRSQQSNFCHLENKKKELVQDALNKAKCLLLDAGFSEKNIEIKINTRKRGVARDIIEEAQSGYDILVIGRRGLSGVKEFFLGSVSQKVFSLSKDISVVIVN